MRTKIISCSAILAAVVLVLSLQGTSAAASQFFPAAGQSYDYKLTWYLTYTNNTRVMDTKFNVYNATSKVTLIPVWLNSRWYMSGTGTSVANDTEITFQHKYLELNSTSISRLFSIVVGNITFKHVENWLYTTKGFYSIFNWTNDILGKTALFAAANTFLDHFDCSLQPGDYFNSPHMTTLTYQYPTNIMAKTADHIVATWSLAGGTVSKNGTYIADAAGQVISYTFEVADSGFSNGVKSVAYSLARPVSSSIPGYPAEWLIIGLIMGIPFAIHALVSRVKKSRID
nr:hypothetical protein [Candidatus Sigynarchaeota archaeon]